MFVVNQKTAYELRIRYWSSVVCSSDLGLQDCLYLGNLSALRDWGHARDYVEMQWLMLQQDEPDDFVIATGVQYSVRQFVELAAAELGITIAFEGEEIGRAHV